MRTAIFLAGILISDAIRNNPDFSTFYKPCTSEALVVAFCVFIILDIIEMFK
jgi:hypothetical protein